MLVHQVLVTRLSVYYRCKSLSYLHLLCACSMYLSWAGKCLSSSQASILTCHVGTQRIFCFPGIRSQQSQRMPQHYSICTKYYDHSSKCGEFSTSFSWVPSQVHAVSVCCCSCIGGSAASSLLHGCATQVHHT